MAVKSEIKAVVLGSGIIGVSTAQELTKWGTAVTLDRRRALLRCIGTFAVVA
ncbi:NAD-binding protein [Pantoea vagans]|uniref:NAD-binding protein n=1 Tax=Pantoea vagans TaxID=470934 RepID=UPI0026AC3CA8